ncbi:hypothetical protein ACLOJK_004746, partial [Asimina triloba]
MVERGREESKPRETLTVEELEQGENSQSTLSDLFSAISPPLQIWRFPPHASRAFRLPASFVVVE